GVLAAALAAVASPPIFYEGLLVKFSLVPVTVTAALLCLAHAEDEWWWGLGAGLCLGTLAALRSNAVIVIPLMLGWVAWPPRRGLGPVIATAVGTTIVLGGLLARAEIAARHDLDSSLWGINFYIGTNPDADGGYVAIPGVREDIVGHVVDARHIA